MKFINYAVLICACVLLSSCLIDDIEQDVVEFDQARFDRERAAWNAANLKNYSFNLYVEGMGSSSTIRFFIENGMFKKREIIKSGKFENIDAGFTTIPAFYGKIEQTVQSAWEEYGGKDPDEVRFSIRVVYNTEHHFPISMRTSRLIAVGNNTFTSGADSGIDFSIKDFVREN
jgi:hypothetical protein